MCAEWVLDVRWSRRSKPRAQQFGDSPIVVRSNVVRPESHPFYEKIGYERKKTQHVYARSLGKHAGA